MDRTGKVLMLHGASSAGKSTMAKALQMGLDEYWWVLEADDITAMQAVSWRTGWWNPSPEERPDPSWDHDLRLARWLAGYFGCIATIVRTGSNVIAVGGWLETAWLVDLAHTLDGIEAYCVGVHCPLEELERRELLRGDRAPGYSRSQIDKVFAHAPHDLETDSFSQGPQECLDQVRWLLSSPPAVPFFERIRRENPAT